ncbi:hypothetical protein [Pseudomonas sp. C2B4]|uniref:hypothetical protein n=1 Tax=Pseudomonas sp. C2B4 TaxID=2735270 RepID=UPI001586201B|nr:hypothetical protein [Pseudomonas sp. C2B4]NUU33639.1 hypothetical protein [Pseudomonas sp. C2B4]
MNPTQVTKNPGALDPEFGGNGQVNLPFPDIIGAIPGAIYALPDNKLLIGLNAESNESSPAKIVRLNVDGSFDSGFGVNGSIEIPLDDDNWLSPVALYRLQGGGYIIMGVTQTFELFEVPDLVVVKLTDGGEFDESFGTGGRVIIAPTDLKGAGLAESAKFKVHGGAEKRVSDHAMMAGAFQGADIQLQDGKILLVASIVYEFDIEKGVVIRLDVDGSFDKSFNGAGFVFIEVPGYLGANNTAYNAKVQPDLKVLVCGRVDRRKEGEFYDAYIIRYNHDGTVDNEYGIAQNGAVIISKSSELLSLGFMALKSDDGGIIAVGNSAMNTGLIVALDESGIPNKVFNRGRPLFSNFLNNLGWSRCVLQQDGKIIAFGTANSAEFPSNAATVTARFDALGNLDATFASKGWTLIDRESTHAILRSAALMPDERVVVSGYNFEIGTPNSGYVTRYLGG